MAVQADIAWGVKKGALARNILISRMGLFSKSTAPLSDCPN